MRNLLFTIVALIIAFIGYRLLFPSCQGYDVEGNFTRCSKPLVTMVCTQDFKPSDRLAHLCRAQAGKVCTCDCHQHLCSRRVSWPSPSWHIRYESRGESIDHIIKPGTNRRLQVEKEIMCMFEASDAESPSILICESGAKTIRREYRCKKGENSTYWSVALPPVLDIAELVNESETLVSRN